MGLWSSVKSLGKIIPGARPGYTWKGGPKYYEDLAATWESKGNFWEKLGDAKKDFFDAKLGAKKSEVGVALAEAEGQVAIAEAKQKLKYIKDGNKILTKKNVMLGMVGLGGGTLAYNTFGPQASGGAVNGGMPSAALVGAQAAEQDFAAEMSAAMEQQNRAQMMASAPAMRAGMGEPMPNFRINATDSGYGGRLAPAMAMEQGA